MSVDPEHSYSNESERANSDIYDDFKLKKNLWSPWFMHIYFSALSGLNGATGASVKWWCHTGLTTGAIT